MDILLLIMNGVGELEVGIWDRGREGERKRKTERERREDEMTEGARQIGCEIEREFIKRVNS